MIKTSLWKLQKHNTDTDFVRAALISLAKNVETPEDIFDATFEPVKTENRQYVYGRGSSELNYTCAIGYKKKERYEKYNSITKKIETQTKERVDWTPLSGNYRGTDCVYIKNDSTPPFDNEMKRVRMLLEKSSITENATKDRKEATISDSCYKEICSGIASGVAAYCRLGLPGDTHKDFKYNYSSFIDTTEAYDIPVQALEYTYHNEKYAAYGFALGDVEICGEHPTDMETDKALRDKKTKPLVLASLCMCIISAIVSLVCPIFIISLLCFLGAAGVTAYSWVRRNTILKSLRLLTQKKKSVSLDELLKKLGMCELTDAEKAMIEGGITK